MNSFRCPVKDGQAERVFGFDKERQHLIDARVDDTQHRRFAHDVVAKGAIASDAKVIDDTIIKVADAECNFRTEKLFSALYPLP